MAIDYRTYYLSQAGGGIESYRSHRYIPVQKGSGFFGRVIKGSVWPLIQSVLPYFKKKTLEGVGELVSHAQSGDSLKEASKKAFKKVGSDMFSDATREIASRFQKGAGVRKRRRRTRKAKPKQRKTRVTKKRRTTTTRKRKSKSALLFP